MKKAKWSLRLLALLMAILLSFTSCELLGGLGGPAGSPSGDAGNQNPTVGNATLDTIPAFSGTPYVIINDNVPFFTADEIKTECFEYYSPLDSLGRCGVVYALVGKATMPPKGDERGDISGVKPSGWVQNKYDTSLVEGGYLYNRAHLIGWQLTDEDDNKQNLITGTRYFNVEGMLPFENMVADYVKETGEKVMYRVTPIYKGNNLVASGVLMEAYSIADAGEELSFCVYCYNVQPGIAINYATGENMLDDGAAVFPDTDGGAGEPVSDEYVLNTKTLRIHRPTCSSVSDMKEENKREYKGTLDGLLADGYVTCGSCFR